ncbi:MAG: glycosyltransferase [Flavobacteriaceae bacterium]|jgi:glycosyltransferase involved in cell wall biosynthesis|nr:glycosyltransferase [Flavobacteriaceae bacterium]
MTPHISIIIPVYNAGKYLSECLDSVLSQIFRDFEVICVNDGSTDNSSDILNRYKSLDNRIIIIDQPNQGVSVARNKGIEMAKGVYIGFVDADDTIEPDMYRVLYDSALKFDADIVISHYLKEQDGHVVKSSLPFSENEKLGKDYISQNFIPYMIAYDGLNTSCTKIYKKLLIDSNSICFPKGVALGEDGLFNFQMFSVASSVVHIPYAGYLYKEVVGSATRNLREKDYFKRDLEVFHFDYKKVGGSLKLTDEETEKLKAIRLADKVSANVFIYLSPGNGLSFKKRYAYVRKMIYHTDVRYIFSKYNKLLLSRKSGFRKIMLLCIRYRLMMPLLVLTTYSYFRNKK